MKKLLLIKIFLVSFLPSILVAQNNNLPTKDYVLTMEEAVELAQMNSIVSMQYKNMMTASYWSYRSYQASRLPSLVFEAALGNFNRSIIPLQDSETGEVYYRQSNNMSNSLQLSVDQRIFATGGYLSLYTNLERLDQFGNNHYYDYYSQPISLSYEQPFFAYNPYKWNSAIEPKRFEANKKEYLENMATVSLLAVQNFWDYALQFEAYKIARGNYDQSKDLYAVSEEKFRLGTINKSTLLQLKLKVYTDSLAMNNSEINLISSKNKLISFIGLNGNPNISVDLDYSLPDLELNFTRVMEDALKNSSFTINQQIEMLEAQQSVDMSKGDRGFSMQLTARFGLSNNGSNITAAYRGLRDQEVIGLSLRVPIYDWGVGRGKVEMALANEETKKNELAQAMVDYQQDLFLKVMQFNNQKTQCEISMEALTIAEESHDLALQSFLSAAITVTDLNSLRNEYDNAQKAYIENLGSYWRYYYELRKITLFDYRTNTHLDKGFSDSIEIKNRK